MAPNYLLHVSLQYIATPRVVRILSLPPSTNFAQLHEVIQTAFGWADCHLHKFEVISPLPPAVRRNSLGPQPKVHLAIEKDYEDEIPLPGMPAPDPIPHKSPSEVTLADIFEDEKYKDMQLEYAYDFTDGWLHAVELLGIARKGTNGKIVCVAGEGHYVAEDAGGIEGWEKLKEAYQVPLDMEGGEDQELRKWYEDVCTNGEKSGLEVWKWDQEVINRDLALL